MSKNEDGTENLGALHGSSVFTPGPWRATSRSDCDWSQDDVMTDTKPSIRICNVFGGHQQEANKRLIAAAPDLFEACSLVNMWMVCGMPKPFTDSMILETVKNAINKAKNGQ